MYIWKNLTNSINQKRGYDLMIGNVSILNTYDTNNKPMYRLYIPLLFWFCTFAERALPLIALQNTELLLKIQFKDLMSVCYCEKHLSNKDLQMNGHLIADYIYVDTNEREIISQTKHENFVEYCVMRKIVSDTLSTNLISISLNAERSVEGSEVIAFFSIS